MTPSDWVNVKGLRSRLVDRRVSQPLFGADGLSRQEKQGGETSPFGFRNVRLDRNRAGGVDGGVEQIVAGNVVRPIDAEIVAAVGQNVSHDGEGAGSP